MTEVLRPTLTRSIGVKASSGSDEALREACDD